MQYIGIIYRWAAGVIGIVSVIYLVWGGFMITAAQDDTEAINKAKEKIMQSIAGLILLFLSAVILYTINPNFFTL
jgi:threonine/homoserine/homoserine lactone efflux protein